MRYIRIAVCAWLVGVGVLLSAGTGTAATCGDGVVQGGEECDPGGGLFRLGNPSSDACDGGGGDGVPGSECFFQFTCCKFNCQFANPGPCFDGNECTITDQCNNTGLCSQGNPAPAGTTCGDPSATECDLADTCNGAGSCVDNLQPLGAQCGGPPPAGECNTDDLCDGAGSCVAQTVPAGTPAPTQCNDGNVCTADQCNGAGGCQNPGVPPGTACGDPASSQCDLPDTCNGSGSCLANNRPNGFACNDGLTCTSTDTCQGGACTGAGDPCAGNPPCQNFCNEPGGSCTAPAGTSCDDGNACDGVNTCNGAGTCVPGAPPGDGSLCEDGNPCTTLDFCVGETCESGPAFVAERRIKLGNSAVSNADMATWGTTPGQIQLAKGGFMPDLTSISASRVRLARGVSVYDVFANTITAKPGAIRNAQGPWPGAQGPFCTLPAFSCGGPDVLLTNLEERTITPGTYGDVELLDGAKLTFAPGVYTVCSVKTGREVEMVFQAGGPSELNVAGKLRIANGSILHGAPGAPWPLVRVAGTRAIFGRDAETQAHLEAPGAKVRVSVDGRYNGTMCGRDLKGATRAVWSCTEPGF